nr:transposase [Salinibaculum sp. KK48]
MDVTSTARNSLAKSLLYHLRNLSTDAIDEQFDGVRDRLFEVLRSQRRLPDCVDVAIDLHEWRFYGSADTDHVITTYPDLGTNRAFCFATLCIVAPRTRFTLAVLPMDANGFRAKREAVRSLLETAREYISIRHVYLDRGFYQVHVVAELEQLGVDYIVRARPSSEMKDRLSPNAETVADAYTMRRKRPPTASEDVTVFAVPHRSNDDEHVWFVTSLDVDASSAKAYAAAFRRRWGIETSYRQIGDFLPRTSSSGSQKI